MHGKNEKQPSTHPHKIGTHVHPLDTLMSMDRRQITVTKTCISTEKIWKDKCNIMHMNMIIYKRKKNEDGNIRVIIMSKG